MAMLSHRQGLSLAAVAIFPYLFFASSGESSSHVYRTGTSEVRIVFFATGEDNRPVETLTANDFVVVDNDLVIRNFRSLSRSSETALSVIAIVDASESVGQHFREIQANVGSLTSAQSSAFPQERLAVVTFSGLKPQLLCDGNCTLPLNAEHFSTLAVGGATPLYDALGFAAKLISRDSAPDIRRVLVLFSDGHDTISISSARDATDAVIAAGAILYAVNVTQFGASSGEYDSLENLTEATGGRTLSISGDTSDILRTILSDLRSSYVVTYSLPTRQSGFHSLRILPKHNLNLRFHCRRGYYYDQTHK